MSDFWPGRRVMVTGGGGFLGTAVVRRLEAAGADQIFVPRSKRLRPAHEGRDRPRACRRAAAAGHPPGGGRRRHRRQPGEPGPVLLRERDHGHSAHGAGAAGRRGEVRHHRHGVCLPQVHARSRSRRTTSGTATRRRRTPRTAWPSGCSWCRARPTAQQYGFNAIYLLPVNLYGPGDNFDPGSSHVIPALIKKCVDAVEGGADHIDVWGTGSASREFLYVDDAAEGIVLAAEQYDDPEPVNLGVGARDHDPGAVVLIARLTRLLRARSGGTTASRTDSRDARSTRGVRGQPSGSQPAPRSSVVSGRPSTGTDRPGVREWRWRIRVGGDEPGAYCG